MGEETLKSLYDKFQEQFPPIVTHKFETQKELRRSSVEQGPGVMPKAGMMRRHPFKTQSLT